MLVYEVWLDKIDKASVMRYQVKGQEKNSHAFYLWTNGSSCNQLPRTQRPKPRAIWQNNGKIMQSASVNIISSEAVMLSKQKSRNSENLHRRITPRPPPLSGKRNQTFQYMKPTAKRETQPHLGHFSRTCENPIG